MEKIGVIDVWTQLMTAVPPEQRNPQAEHIFRRYGRLDVYYEGTKIEKMVEEMDGVGVEKAVLSGADKNWVRETVRRHPQRFIGQAHVDPTNIMKAVREMLAGQDQFSSR